MLLLAITAVIKLRCRSHFPMAIKHFLVGYNRANITELYGITHVGQRDLYAQFYTTGTEKLMDGAICGGIQSDFRGTSAHNNSLELKYDTGGATNFLLKLN